MSLPKDTGEASSDGMPHEPWFETAARATRVRFDGRSPREQETEWSLMRQLHTRRRVRRAWWPLPLLALLGVSAAWAEEMRSGLGWLTLEVQAWLRPPETPAVTAPLEVVSAASARSKLEPAPQADTELGATSAVSSGDSDVAAPAAAPLAVSSSDVRAASLATASTPRPAISTPQPSVPPAVATEPAGPLPSAASDLSLYRSAHHAHFVERDWAAALRGWDAYLAGAQRGQFVPEARYNRGIALAALGRSQEATEAFTPFAQGVYGNYRTREAKTRIEQLSAGAQ